MCYRCVLQLVSKKRSSPATGPYFMVGGVWTVVITFACDEMCMNCGFVICAVCHHLTEVKIIQYDFLPRSSPMRHQGDGIDRLSPTTDLQPLHATSNQALTCGSGIRAIQLEHKEASGSSSYPTGDDEKRTRTDEHGYAHKSKIGKSKRSLH